MATGLTEGIAKGSVTELPEFAMLVSEFFDPHRMLSVEQQSAGGLIVANTVEPDVEFYTKALQRDASELEEVVSWDAATAESKANMRHLEWLKDYLQSVRSQREIKRRYQAMLAQVEVWEPPTQQEDLKRFMGKRLTDSMENDTYYLRGDPLSHPQRPERMSGEEYRQVTLKGIARQIDVHTGGVVERLAQASATNQSARELADSLNSWQKPDVLTAA
jgi:hypothetical protein